MAIDNKTLKDTHVTIEELISVVQVYFPLGNLDLIMRAYVFAENHYARINHPTGISYIKYVLNVAVGLH